MLKKILAILTLMLLPALAQAQTMGLAPSGSQTSGAYVANAVDFDGTSDWLRRNGDLDNSEDDQQYTLSVWIRIDNETGNDQYFASDVIDIAHYINSGLATQRMENTSGTIIANLTTTDTLAAGAEWIHLLYSADMSVPTCLLFIEDAVPAGISGDTCDSGTFDFTQTDWGVAARGTDGSLKFNGCIAELIFNTNQFLDITQASVRRNFSDIAGSSGKPVSVGSDGSDPFSGDIPEVYMADPAATAGNNSGNGGNFSINGSPNDCSTSPTD